MKYTWYQESLSPSSLVVSNVVLVYKGYLRGLYGSVFRENICCLKIFQVTECENHDVTRHYEATLKIGDFFKSFFCEQKDLKKLLEQESFRTKVCLTEVYNYYVAALMKNSDLESELEKISELASRLKSSFKPDESKKMTSILKSLLPFLQVEERNDIMVDLDRLSEEDND